MQQAPLRTCYAADEFRKGYRVSTHVKRCVRVKHIMYGPLAKRWSTARLLISITRIMCGREPVGIVSALWCQSPAMMNRKQHPHLANGSAGSQCRLPSFPHKCEHPICCSFCVEHLAKRPSSHLLRVGVVSSSWRQVEVEQRLGAALPPQHLDARFGVPVLAPGAPGAHFGFDPVDGTNEATHVHTLNPGCPTIPPPTNEVLIPFDRLDRMVVFL